MRQPRHETSLLNKDIGIKIVEKTGQTDMVDFDLLTELNAKHEGRATVMD